MNTILELLKYTVPAFIVLLACYLIVSKFLVEQTQRKHLTLLQETNQTTLRLRLQAYERLALFMERISPRELIPRVYETGMTVRDLQQAMGFNIKTEFEHNLSQQIYVSAHVWNTVKGVKEQELSMINQLSAQLPPDSPANELHARMINYIVSEQEDLPTDMALTIINEEAKRMLSRGLE